MSLVELLVTISLTSILGMIVLAAVLNNNQLHRVAVNEAAGLGDVRDLTERLGRDVRSARAVGPFVEAGPSGEISTVSQLVLWIDLNSDFIRTTDEIVTWQVVGSSWPKTVVRSTSAGQMTVARTVSTFSFCYWAANQVPAVGQVGCTTPVQSMTQPLTFTAVPIPASYAPLVQLVTTTLTYDARIGSQTTPRTVAFSDRIRNAS